MQRVGNALSTPAITNLTKPRNVVGAIKKQIKSVFNKLTQNTWINTEENYCMSNATCDLLMNLGNLLAEDPTFRGNLTPKQADSVSVLFVILIFSFLVCGISKTHSCTSMQR
jgi:hypothetical protein